MRKIQGVIRSGTDDRWEVGRRREPVVTMAAGMVVVDCGGGRRGATVDRKSSLPRGQSAIRRR